MGLAVPHILRGQVMHKRLWPRLNQFTYSIYYLALPLSQLEQINDGWRCGYNRSALVSFYDRDHGPCDGTSLDTWMRHILAENNISAADGEIVLITMPRVLGYVFNPVSFWLCHDKAGNLRAVLCEVNNTFGETHLYLCAHADARPLSADDVPEAHKLFHVSPFLTRDGRYTFRFAVTERSCGVWIDYYNPDGRAQLLTALTGRLEPLTRASLSRAFWQTPLVGLRAIFLIHWQALKLVAKRIKYVPKPAQLPQRLTRTLNKFNAPETGSEGGIH